MSFLNETVVLIGGIILIVASVPLVLFFDRGKVADHVARTLVSMGVGLLAAFVAVTVFELNAQRLESERILAQQQAKRSKMLALVSNLRFFAIEYGFAAYQIHAVLSDCGPDNADAGPSDACREGARYAANAGRLLPQDYPLVTALSEASNAFAKAIRVPTLLTDAEVTISGRMPVVIENYLGLFLNTGQKPSTDAGDRFRRTLSDLESAAADASMAYCIFAAALVEGEAKLEATVSSLEDALRKGQQPIHDIVLSFAKNVNMGDFDCANPSGQIERILPVAGSNK
jgi:hypothetical protein